MKLVAGEGSVTYGACWMSAINWYAYSGKDGFSWNDHPICVDPVIQKLCIILNDRCGDGNREELIGPHLFTPVGTNMGRPLTTKRGFYCADKAVRYLAPRALDNVDRKDEADKLRRLPAITNVESAVRVAGFLVGEERSQVIEHAANAATYAASHHADAVAVYAGAIIAYMGPSRNQDLLDLILELCAMGKEEPKACKTKGETVEFITEIHKAH